MSVDEKVAPRQGSKWRSAETAGYCWLPSPGRENLPVNMISGTKANLLQAAWWAEGVLVCPDASKRSTTGLGTNVIIYKVYAVQQVWYRKFIVEKTGRDVIV